MNYETRVPFDTAILLWLQRHIRMCAYVTYTYTCIGKIDVYTPHAHTHTHVCHASDRGIAEYSKGGSASVCANKKRLLNLCDKINLVNDIIYSPIQSLFITGKKNAHCLSNCYQSLPRASLGSGEGELWRLLANPQLPALVTKADLSLQRPGACLPNRSVDQYL